MKSKILIIVSIFFFLIPKSKSYSQLREYVFYPVEGGLISEQLKSISHSDNGFIWGATDNGLMKFDGTTTTFIHSELPSHYIKSLSRGKDHSIFVIHDLGVGKITSKGNQYEINQIIDGSATLQPNTLYYPKSIYEVNENEYWIGETSTVVHFVNNKIHRYTLSGQSQSPHYVRSVLFEVDGYDRTWMFGYNVGVFQFDKENDRLKKVTLPLQLHNIAYTEKVGFKTFIIGAKEGVFEMKVNREGQVTSWKLICDIKDVSTVCRIDEELIVVGTWNNGVYAVDLTNNTAKKRKLYLNGIEDIIDLEKVEGQGIWVSSTENIGLLKEVPFQSIDIVDKHKIIESAKEVTKGKVLISLGDSIRQLEWMDNDWQQTFVYQCPERSRVFSIYNKELFIGTYDGHIFSTPLNQNAFLKVDKVNARGSIISMFVDEENHLWAAAEYDQGLIKLNGKEVSSVQKDFLKSTFVIKGNESETFYLGGKKKHQTLSKFNYKTQDFEKINLRFPREVNQDLTVNDLLITKQEVYLATTDGCFYFSKSDKSTEIVLKELWYEGLNRNTPYKAIEQTPDNAIWLASYNSIIRLKDAKVQYFDKTYGLPSNAIKVQGLESDSEGRLWIASEKGLVVSETSDLLQRKTKIPDIRLFTIENKEERLWTNDQLILPYKSNIKIKYDIQEFPSNNVKYQFRIKSADSLWTLPSKVDELSMLSLNNGDYELEVKAQQMGRLLSDTARLKFRVITPFYKKTWFFVLLIVVVAALIVLLIQRYFKNLKEKGKRLEYLVEMRAKEIATQRTKIMEQQQEIYKKKQMIFEAEKFIAEAELKNTQLKAEQLSDLLEERNKNLTVVTLNIVEKNNFMESLRKQLKEVEKTSPDLKKVLKPLHHTLDQSEKTDKDWEEFQHYFDGVHKDFNIKLKEAHPALTSHDLRHCSLIRLNLSLIECANLLGISQDSLKTSRYRLKKKLELAADQNLQDYILGFNVGSKSTAAQ
ncbi:hypothetical protein KMW28_05395 [Flammeovirga yaeyamensis]|uniref:Two component regulator three Y domain-containing protein n=1 Tax=Flammeovirga yaeyamensis TaxID=367791 RepID=A0AAX1N6A6_9BACT|nr:hypothetical protein [Flammeovirga yaeyamensis]MBB3697599.1 ligand-binding sensor domain-containing protein [Flammeovirga yaeyamensis]NMF36289.1 hypothetical protein [Flammeovirga yaeyamensis]QWG03016.1 hypothetical protein KMW28_05395 [Flammeovirga yaeyamensis]